ncbi:MAG: response regulator [Caldithrix sp.]|nr:response regulator [Caldithrix sp.]
MQKNNTTLLRPATVIIVDDDPENVDSIEDILVDQNYKIYKAYDGEQALKKIDTIEPDLILLDAIMPKVNGFEVAKKLKTNANTRLIPIIMVTALEGMEDRLEGFEAGVDDFISKPVNVFELRARIRNLVKLREYVGELENAEHVIFSLARAVEAKDKYTEDHCGRMANFAQVLGKKLGLNDYDLKIIYQGAYLHDIGKIGITDTILLKPGPLTKDEFEIVKRHPIEGEEICKPLKSLKPVLPIIRYHHERFNGSGYPEGLQGEDIPYLARLIGVVDCYDSLTTKRPYRDALPREDALNVIHSETEQGMWDPSIVKVLDDIINHNHR